MKFKKADILANKFIKEIGDRELRPPVYNSSVLVHQSGWHTKKYFKKYYHETVFSPAFLLVYKKEMILYISVTVEKNWLKIFSDLFGQNLAF